jgi:uncharacterized protein (DUF1800 family)
MIHLPWRGRARTRAVWSSVVLSTVALAVASRFVEHPLAFQLAVGPPPGVYEIVARHSDKCLSIRGTSLNDGAAANQWACVGEPNQRWSFEPLDDGYYHIVSRHSGKALEVAGASLRNNARIIQNSLHDGAHQQFRFEPAGDGYYRLIARHSGRAVEVAGGSIDNDADVIQFRVRDAARQQWLLRAVSVAPTSSDAVRFLEQATFGPTTALVEHVRDIGFAAFLDEQFQAAMSSYPTLPLYPTTRDTTACPNGSACQRDNYTMYPLQNRFFVNALYGEDQLRQRVAFALHQILVVSGVEARLPSWMAPYLQLLDRHAFGNYRDLLYDLTLNPAMGNYLDVNGNTRTRPNENYAREILQLFSIGTVRLNIDGSVQLDEAGQPIPTYTQDTVNAFARVFTGWRFAPPPATGVPNYIDPMVVNEAQHDVGAKTLLNGVTLPAGQTTTKDLNDAIDNIFNDPNVGPFISRQLIQHLVTSNPSPAYVARVASVFNGGAAPRGDLKAVIRAILLDPEARGDVKTDANYGRLRHPAQFIPNVLRAFNARSADGMTTSDGYLNPQSVAMGMDVFRPPSVFSYFSPATVVPGSAGVRGPEFGIFSTSTALRRLNFVNTMVFSRITVSANAPSGTSLDFTPLLPLASAPPDLVAALDDLLMHGSMSDDMRLSIEQAVSLVASTNALKRVRTAVYLVLTSSQYQVER